MTETATPTTTTERTKRDARCWSCGHEFLVPEAACEERPREMFDFPKAGEGWLFGRRVKETAAHCPECAARVVYMEDGPMPEQFTTRRVRCGVCCRLHEIPADAELEDQKSSMHEVTGRYLVEGSCDCGTKLFVPNTGELVECAGWRGGNHMQYRVHCYRLTEAFVVDTLADLQDEDSRLSSFVRNFYRVSTQSPQYENERVKRGYALLAILHGLRECARRAADDKLPEWCPEEFAGATDWPNALRVFQDYTRSDLANYLAGGTETYRPDHIVWLGPTVDALFRTLKETKSLIQCGDRFCAALEVLVASTNGEATEA